jgi:hypothetical protein
LLTKRRIRSVCFVYSRCFLQCTSFKASQMLAREATSPVPQVWPWERRRHSPGQLLPSWRRFFRWCRCPHPRHSGVPLMTPEASSKDHGSSSAAIAPDFTTVCPRSFRFDVQPGFGRDEKRICFAYPSYVRPLFLLLLVYTYLVRVD